ncbi:transketolase [Pseudoclavibacter soli]|uniref:transketolase n=1 Tax=Pseudoclavibacter soli TaxID=452623 RepID=UPI00040F5776|nr:transketolase [Pseudoclavibacter soli]
MSSVQWSVWDQKAVNTAKVLAADAVEKVGSGHPGTAISLAPVAYLLYQRYLRHDPADPTWIGRDRFVLSPGHTSLTLYTQLYFSGYGLELDDLRSLRTAGSLTPGHPEYGHTPGVEITTGPLGQGLASAVGFAYAERFERNLLDPDAPEGTSPFDHNIYVIASDGDLQEGVTGEASSLAGSQELGSLVVIYDDNHISIEDDTNIAFSEDVLARYEAYGWHTQRVDWTNNGGEYREDVSALADAIDAAKAETRRPSIIALRTIIGWPSPTKADTGAIHGSKLGGDEVAALKRELGFDETKTFDVDPEVLAHVRQVADRGAEAHRAWNERYEAWEASHPANAALLNRLLGHRLPADLSEALPVFEAGKAIATRAASGKVINALAPLLPELWGGSADLAGSNNTTIEGADSFGPVDRTTDTWHTSPAGRVLHFGIREHAMASILNGIVLHGPTRPFGGTFLIFSDYQRPALRLAALMGVPSIFVWTHDSIGLGEDGPTHQPVEQLATLRAIPDFTVVRPADANEVAYAWLGVLGHRSGPVGLVLTRQAVPTFERGDDAQGDTLAPADGVLRGAYVLAEARSGNPEVLLIATGSEVSLALEARDVLEGEGIGTRVVSAPSLEWFAAQSDEYRESVLPKAVRARVSVEAGSALTWRGIVGDAGRSVSLEHYGASASASELFDEFGITSTAVAQAARESLAEVKGN